MKAKQAYYNDLHWPTSLSPVLIDAAIDRQSREAHLIGCCIVTTLANHKCCNTIDGSGNASKTPAALSMSCPSQVCDANVTTGCDDLKSIKHPFHC